MMKSKQKSKSKLQITNDQLPITNHRYILRRGLGVWELTFQGKTALLKHEQGVFYVSYLLLNPPPQPIHGMALALKVISHYRKTTAAATEMVDIVHAKAVTIPRDATLAEYNLRFDEAEAAAGLRRKQLQLEAILEDPMESDQVKADALRELESIYAFEKAKGHRTTDTAQKAVRTVRMAIKRFHQRLACALDHRGNPHPVLVPFANHLQEYLLVPSARFAGPNGNRARSGIAGCFTYEPPPGVVWTAG